jgi:hypothetical protein
MQPAAVNLESPNPRLQRTRVGPSGRRSPLSRQPLGAAVKSVGRACGESLVLRVRSQASLRRGLLPHHRPGPIGFCPGEPVEQQAQRGVSSGRGSR